MPRLHSQCLQSHFQLVWPRWHVPYYVMRAWCWSLATGRTQSSEQAPIFMGLWWDGKWSVNLLLVFLGSQHQLDLWLSFPSPSTKGTKTREK